MKEPGDIYLDELVRELRRRLHGQHQVPAADALRVAQEAEQAAAEATIYHLVQQLGFLENEALDVIADFRNTKLDADARANRERLHHRWTDVALRRQRRRAG